MSNTTATTSPAPVGFKWLHLGWSIGSLGAALFLNGINFLLLFFLTTVLHINPAVAGLMITAGKFWDMLTNPAIGMLSDKMDTSWGRRRPFLLVGAVVTAIGFAALYSPPEFGTENMLIAYCVACFLLVSTGYTLFNVPYMAMPAEMFDNYQERSVMISYRVVFIAIGTLVAGSGAKLITEQAGGGRPGYATMGMIIGAGIFIFMALSCWGTRTARFTLREAKSYTAAEQARTAWNNKPFMVLMLVKFTQLLGLASVGPIILFTFQFVLGNAQPGKALVQFGLVNTLTQILSLPIWLRITKRIEKRLTYVLASVIFIAGTLTWLLAAGGEPTWATLLRGCVTGFAAGGLLLMGQSMLPDVIEYDYRRTGLRREGVFSGLYSFVEKTSFAIAPAIVGFILAAYNFNKMSPVQPPQALTGILIVQSVLPVIYFTLSVAALYFYNLTEKTLKSTTLEKPNA